jgi:dTDP-4-dehydrorhamnose reductase
MQILLLGKVGQLGWELQRSLAPLGEVTALDYPEINFSDPTALLQSVRHIKPQVIINAAAYTAVDKAESESELALIINGTCPGLLAEEARKSGSAFIHYSTEYVFDGSKGAPYREDDLPNPLNVYGETKLAGERAVQEAGESYLILRTSWVYSTRVGGFVNKVLEWSRQQERLRIVSDQVGNPTWCRMLAETTAQLLAMGRKDPVNWLKEYRGLYHVAGSGSASRLEWAEQILLCDPNRQEQVAKEIRPAFTSEFPSPAVRPLYSPLNCDRFYETFGLRLPPWSRALQMALELN